MYILVLKDNNNAVSGMIVSGVKSTIITKLKKVCSSFYKEMKGTPAFDESIELTKKSTFKEAREWLEKFAGYKSQLITIKPGAFHSFSQNELVIKNIDEVFQPKIVKKVTKKIKKGSQTIRKKNRAYKTISA